MKYLHHIVGLVDISFSRLASSGKCYFLVSSFLNKMSSCAHANLHNLNLKNSPLEAVSHFRNPQLEVNKNYLHTQAVCTI